MKDRRDEKESRFKSGDIVEVRIDYKSQFYDNGDIAVVVDHGSGCQYELFFLNGKARGNLCAWFDDSQLRHFCGARQNLLDVFDKKW